MTPSLAAPAIALTEVRKAYDSVVAVDDVSLSAEPGSLLVLLGPSGCGKTTMLRLIAGLEIPDSGTIALGGVTVSAKGTFVPPEDRRVGMVFQDYALFPHLSAGANIEFAMPRLPIRERRARAADLLALVGLAGRAGRYPHQLSGGEQQRVALAR
ncbi:MAG: ABC transporter ATP-binding protein, partial [Anaerolinea sp.]|nr:ABC transporter ATP-binding protein [Anaerolinea sp.]